MNVTPAIAAIFIAIVMCSFTSFTIFVVKGLMSVDTLIEILKAAGFILIGALGIPLTYRRRPNGQISFHIDSDPPKPPPPEIKP